MSNWKKAVCLLLAVLLVIVTAGCGKGTSKAGSDPGVQAGTAAGNTDPSGGSPSASDPSGVPGNTAGGASSDQPETATGSGIEGDHIRNIEEMLADQNKVDQAVESEGIAYGLRKGIKCYLLLGVDDPRGNYTSGGSHDGVMCDMIQLYVLDENAKQYTTLQISRDTMVDVDILRDDGKIVSSHRMQLTYAHEFTGDPKINAENVARAVSRLLGGIEIDGFVSLMYGAIAPVNDALGGVTVKIEDDFSEADPAMVQGEEINLTGEQAYKFLRYRMNVGDGSNTGRLRRQQRYTDAFASKLRSQIRANSGIVNDIYNAAAPYMASNMSSGQITNLVIKASGYSSKGTKTLSGSEKSVTYSTGYTHIEREVDQATLDQTVLDLFYEPLD